MKTNRQANWLTLLGGLVVCGVLLAAAAAGILVYRVLSQPASPVELTGFTSGLSQSGVLITYIHPGSPAEQVGLRRGDIILSVGGHPVNDRASLRDRITWQTPGADITLSVLHGDELRNVVVTLADEAPLLGVDGLGDGETVAAAPPESNLPELSSFLPPALVVAVVPGSPAEQAGLKPDDLITVMNDQSIGTAQDVIRLMGMQRPGDTLQLIVQRQGISVIINVKLATHPNDVGKAFLGINLPPLSP
jgi:S1-C subfamily serine protease